MVTSKTRPEKRKHAIVVLHLAGLIFFECHPLARLRRADAPCEFPLIGVDRKWLADRQNDANDPSETWALLASIDFTELAWW
jgi:hypothetical protein